MKEQAIINVNPTTTQEEIAKLTQVQFFKKNLKGIEFSDSKIDGIAVSIEYIKGAIINQFQAIDLLYLIGVKIK